MWRILAHGLARDLTAAAEGKDTRRLMFDETYVAFVAERVAKTRGDIETVDLFIKAEDRFYLPEYLAELEALAGAADLWSSGRATIRDVEAWNGALAAVIRSGQSSQAPRRA